MINFEQTAQDLNANNRYYLAFNKLSGALIGMVNGGGDDFTPQSDYLDYKLVDMNPHTQIWQGDYKTGRLVNIDQTPAPIYEQGLNERAGVKILKDYPLHKQLNIVIDCISDLLESANITNQQFELMTQSIEQTRVINARYKQAYEDSDEHLFISKRQAAQELADKLEGGIHELIGPRE